MIVGELDLMEFEWGASDEVSKEYAGIASGKRLHLVELDGAEVVFEFHLVELERVASG